MNLENILEDSLLLICPNSVKTSVLKYLADNKKLMKIKFMTLQEFKKKHLFDYDIETIKYLVDKHQMKVANAKETLEDLYYIDENKDYDSEKLKQLVNYKKELRSNDLLIYDNLFKNSLSNYKIKVYGYGELDKFDEALIKKVNGIVIVEQKQDKEYKIYKFDNIEEEVEYLFDEIVRLIQEENVDINKILVANLDKEYFPYIKRYEKYYGIEFQLPEKNSIIGTELVKDFLTELDNGFSSGVQYWFDKKTYRFEVVSELLYIVKKYYSDKNLEEVKDLSDLKEQIEEEINNNEVIQAKLSNKKSKEKIDDFLSHVEQEFEGSIQAWFDKETIKDEASISVLKSLLSVINKYAKYIENLSEVKELIKDDLKHTYIKQPKKTNVVQVVNVLDPIEDDQHLFLVGFNDSIPMTYKDTEYITDNIRNEVARSTTYELNLNSKVNTLAWLSNVKNMQISYKEKSPFNEYNASSLLDEMKNSVKAAYQFKDIARDVRMKKYGDNLDKYRKYSDANAEKEVLNYSKEFAKADYLGYDNQFNADPKKVAKSNLKLSYSSLNEFCECPFKYYIDYVLKLSINEENFAASLGDVIHKILEDAFDKDDQQIKDEYREYVKDKDLFNYTNDERTQMFIEVVEENLMADPSIISFIREQEKENFKVNGLKHLTEEEIVIDDIVPNMTFKGKIDKIMYDENGGHIRALLVDYKTGSNVVTKLSEIEYGLSMQLPIYMYLVNKAVEQDKIDEFKNKNVKVYGFYIQTVINKKPTFDAEMLKKHYKRNVLNTFLSKNWNEAQLRQWDSLKLNGITVRDKDVMLAFDENFDKTDHKNLKSKYIRSLYKSSSGVSGPKGNVIPFDTEKTIKKGKVEIKKGLSEYITDVENKIKEVANSILSGHFLIEPVRIGNNDRSCAFCSFNNICYKKPKDYYKKEVSEDKKEDNGDEVDE